jgi:hypothetical protein
MIKGGALTKLTKNENAIALEIFQKILNIMHYSTDKFF